MVLNLTHFFNISITMVEGKFENTCLKKLQNGPQFEHGFLEAFSPP